jgi:hypothetical protein
VTRALLQVSDDPGKASVEVPPLIQRTVLVQRRREKRVSEPQRLTVTVENARGYRVGHSRGTSADRLLDGGHRRLGERRRRQGGGADARREPREPITQDLTEDCRYRQRFPWFNANARSQQAGGDLERIERIPACRLFELTQHRSEETCPKSRLNELIQCLERKRSDFDSLWVVEANGGLPCAQR